VYPPDMDINYDLEEYKRKLKNVKGNADAREKNTAQGKNSGYGAWKDYGSKSNEGAQSQSSWGASPTDGQAPTPTQPTYTGKDPEKEAQLLKDWGVEAQPKKTGADGTTSSALLEPSTLQELSQPSQPVLPPGDWHQKKKEESNTRGKDGGKGSKGGGKDGGKSGYTNWENKGSGWNRVNEPFPSGGKDAGKSEDMVVG